jgi:hypothetical protein
VQRVAETGSKRGLTGVQLPEQDEAANGGVTTKLRLLLIERARFNGPGLFDDPVDAQLP